MQLYFIRHGQSENNLIWQRTGSSKGRTEDPALTELGRRQAQALADFVSQPMVYDREKNWDGQNVCGFGITHLYSSLMVRAVETGMTVAHALDLPLVAWPDIHERGGIYLKDEVTGERVGLPGHNRAFFQTQFPDLILPKSLGDDGWWNRPYENRPQAMARAVRFLHDLLDRHDNRDDRVAVISHGGFFDELVHVLLALPENGNRWFFLNNTAISRFDFRSEGVALVYSNRAGHLPAELIS